MAGRWGNYALGAVIALAAAAISPPGIALLANRPDVSVRVTTLSLALVVFLLALCGAVVARGRLRTAFFYLLIFTVPLPLLAGLEAAAIAAGLADRVAPIENLSLLKNRGRWPPYLLSEARWAPQIGELKTYRPWSGNGIAINALGLRTAPPRPKPAGEWRIAMTGGSTVFGWRVLDPDTLPAQLQQAIRRRHPNVTVYNFGIEGATMARELELTERFHQAYEIDQVLFYTGGNDAHAAYLEALSAGPASRRFWSNLNSFELIRAGNRLMAVTVGPSAQALDHLDRVVLPQVVRDNPLRQTIRAADAFCRSASLRCSVMLQPTLLTRRPPRGPETVQARNAVHIYPRLAVLGAGMYRDALAASASMPVDDLSGVLDPADEPFYVDSLHLNEAGNAFLAERLAERLDNRLP